MNSKRNPRAKPKIPAVKEEAATYNTLQTEQRYKEEVYTKVKIQDLILFGIYSVSRNGETCTFERLVAECFLNFPKVFGFKRYPDWPDSLKFDRPLRKLREEGLIRGGMGGRSSPGEITLTEFGEEIAKETETILSGQIVPRFKSIRGRPRSSDEKLLTYLKESLLFKKFLTNKDSFSPSEPELRNLLRCTLETPQRIVKENLVYCKKVAELYNEQQLLDFLLFLENKFLKKGGKNG